MCVPQHLCIAGGLGGSVLDQLLDQLPSPLLRPTPIAQVPLKPFCPVGARSFWGRIAELLITGSQPSWKAGVGWTQPEAHVPSRVCRASVLTASCA